MSGQLLTPSQVAEVLGMSEDWVIESLRDGTLPGRQIRRRWYVTRAELDGWLAGASSPATVPARRLLTRGRR